MNTALSSYQEQTRNCLKQMNEQLKMREFVRLLMWTYHRLDGDVMTVKTLQIWMAQMEFERLALHSLKE